MKQISKGKLFQLLFVVFFFLPLFKGGGSKEAISIIGISFDLIFGGKYNFSFIQLFSLVPILTIINLFIINFKSNKILKVGALLLTILSIIFISILEIRFIGVEGLLYSFDIILKIAIGLYFFNFIKSKAEITKILGVFISILVLNTIFSVNYSNFIHQFIIQTLYILVLIGIINIIYINFGNKLINKKSLNIKKLLNKDNLNSIIAKMKKYFYILLNKFLNLKKEYKIIILVISVFFLIFSINSNDDCDKGGLGLVMENNSMSSECTMNLFND